MTFNTSSIVTNFIQQPLPPDSDYTGRSVDQPGALGMGQRAATGITTFNQFWNYIMPLLGAWIADSYWGRYKTINIALGVAIIGHIILTLAGVPAIIKNGTGGSLACLIIGIFIIGIGGGAFKSNVSPLIIEQVNITHNSLPIAPTLVSLRLRRFNVELLIVE